MNKLWTSFVIIILLLITGTIFYHTYEGWSIIDSAYFSTSTLTTTNSGRLEPSTDLSKVFTILYSLSAVSVGLYALSYLGRNQHPKLEKALLGALSNMPVKRIAKLRSELRTKA